MCQGSDYIKLLEILPEIKSAMMFLNKNDVITGANNPPGQVTTWVPMKFTVVVVV